jgi:SAM-dependent methyltransferase
MRELNLLEEAPRSDKKVKIGQRTPYHRAIARQFDARFFTGGGTFGYRNYKYDGRWKAVVRKLQQYYKINSSSSVLDIGCACGFLLFDLQDMISGIRVAGLDISEWAINNAMRGYAAYAKSQGLVGNSEDLEILAKGKIAPHLVLGSKTEPWRLPWADNSFDLVLSINTAHNLPPEQCVMGIKEIVRVSRDKKSMFIQVDAYRTEEERRAMDAWNLTALTVMSTTEWLKFFKRAGYQGDYYWSTIKIEGNKAVRA